MSPFVHLSVLFVRGELLLGVMDGECLGKLGCVYVLV